VIEKLNKFIVIHQWMGYSHFSNARPGMLLEWTRTDR